MFDLLQQLVEAITKQQLKKLMLQVQDEIQDYDIEVTLTKAEEDDSGASVFFTAKHHDTPLKIVLTQQSSSMLNTVDLSVGVDWDGDNC